MSSGIHAIRLIVMELGRFIDGFVKGRRRGKKRAPTIAFSHSDVDGG
jgi:hypothetical protein